MAAAPLNLQDQLSELNAMERQQDVNVWTATAIFTAANGVLLLALFAISEVNLRWKAIIVSTLGLGIALGWTLITRRAFSYIITWVGRARDLEEHLQIPSNAPNPRTPQRPYNFRVWDLDAPSGIPNRYVIYALSIGFVVFWILVFLWGYPP